MMAVFLVVGSVVALADEGDPEMVTIRSRVGPMRSWSDLRAKGVIVPRLDREQNAAWTYIEAINLCETPTELFEGAIQRALSGTWPDPEGAQLLDDFLELNRDALVLVHRAAAMRSCVLPYLGRPEDPLVTLNAAALPGMRFLMELVELRTRQLLHRGAVDEALAEAVVMVRGTCHIGQGLELLDGVMAAAGLQQAAGLVREIVVEHQPSDSALREACEALGEVVPPSMVRYVRNDRATWNEALALMFDSPAWMSLIASRVPSSPPHDAGWDRMYSGLLRAVLPDRQAKTTMAKLYDYLELRAGQTPFQAAWVSPYRRKLLVANVPLWNVLARQRVEQIATFASGVDRARCELEMVRIIVALEAYRAKHGSYPDDLAAVAALMGGALPKDPYAKDDDYRYRREGGGWVLYSVGENYVDDGGTLGEGGQNFVTDVVFRHALKGSTTQPVKPAKPR